MSSHGVEGAMLLEVQSLGSIQWKEYKVIRHLLGNCSQFENVTRILITNRIVNHLKPRQSLCLSRVWRSRFRWQISKHAVNSREAAAKGEAKRHWHHFLDKRCEWEQKANWVFSIQSWISFWFLKSKSIWASVPFCYISTLNWRSLDKSTLFTLCQGWYVLNMLKETFIFELSACTGSWLSSLILRICLHCLLSEAGHHKNKPHLLWSCLSWQICGVDSMAGAWACVLAPYCALWMKRAWTQRGHIFSAMPNCPFCKIANPGMHNA